MSRKHYNDRRRRPHKDEQDNTGQVCLAGTRRLVQESIAAKILVCMTDTAANRKQGAPGNFSTKVGPLIHPEHQQWTIRDGARLV